MTLRLAALARGKHLRLAMLAQGKPSGFRRTLRLAVLGLWLAGAVITWNVVFDALIVRGARDYVDRQQLFIDGHGARQDMQAAMSQAKTRAFRAASLWTTVELLPAAFVVWALRRRP